MHVCGPLVDPVCMTRAGAAAGAEDWDESHWKDIVKILHKDFTTGTMFS